MRLVCHLANTLQRRTHESPPEQVDAGVTRALFTAIGGPAPTVPHWLLGNDVRKGHHHE